MTEHAEDDAQGADRVVEKKDTEVVVSVVPTQIRGNSFTIRHSDMRTLRPHQWLTGEYINAEESTVYLADPARNSAEQAESDNAANKFRY
ncbi:hypothetical protein NQZ68_010813 [Dissostichus eleginoides]|nr:hypothetical protein NQZ68_010813 [Dissostichus eleginoides]